MMFALGVVLGCGLGAVVTTVVIAAMAFDKEFPIPPTSWEQRYGRR